jgi:hypothetical protein
MFAVVLLYITKKMCQEKDNINLLFREYKNYREGCGYGKIIL